MAIERSLLNRIELGGRERESLILCQGLDSLQLLDCTNELTCRGGEKSQAVFMCAGERENSEVLWWAEFIF